MRLAALTALCLLCAGPALAEEPEPSCPVRLYRAEEDCRNLAGQTLAGIEALRLVPLGDNATLTFGGEARLAFEQVTVPNFGFGHFPESDAFARRAYLDADLRTAEGPRFFLQLVSAEESGRKPVERPFDRDTLDLYQGFVDLPFAVAEVPILLRVGRQEVDLQGNRLVAIRDLANVRRNFDLALVEARPWGFILDAFGGRPVVPNPAIFNDGGDPHESFAGLTAEHPVYAEPGSLLQAGTFFFRRTRAQAVYSEGVGRDDRNTFGLRLHGNVDAFDIAVQGALQRGAFRNLTIDASGIALDTGWRFVNLPGQPRLGLSGGRASGDRRRGDGKLGTFDAIYPNLSYFTDASPIYPGNSADIEPNITIFPRPGITVQTGIDILWRLSNQDAVYVPPGIPLIPGNGQTPDHEVSLPYIRGAWSPSPYWLIELSYVAILPGALIEEAGGRRAHFFRSAITARF